uniref:Uncharacterized protein n=1 Tax=Suricata suricatta TaxID=37032 RepID=A0A673TY93_SURSU
MWARSTRGSGLQSSTSRETTACPGAGISMAGRPENKHTHLPSACFPSGLEVEITCGSLVPDAQPHRGDVEKHLTLSSCVLAVHWRTESLCLLQTSIVNVLHPLSLVMWTIQCFGVPKPMLKKRD